MRRSVDLTGKTFHRWAVLSFSGDGLWLCRCECGTEKLILGGNLQAGKSRSCGCYRAEQAMRTPGGYEGAPQTEAQAFELLRLRWIEPAARNGAADVRVTP